MRELDLGIYNSSIDAIATGSITCSDKLRNTKFSAAHFSSLNTGIYRPASATAADNWRWAGDLTPTTGLLAHTGANYADTTATSESVELWYYGVRPDTDVVDAINRAMEFILYDTLEPLSCVDDAGMSNSGVTSWTKINNDETVVKSTTASDVWLRGKQSLSVTNASVNGGVYSSTFDVSPLRQLLVAAMIKTTVGTTTVQPYDVTNGAVFGMAFSTSERKFQYIWNSADPAPATCKQAAIKISNSSASGVMKINAVWALRQDDMTFLLPSWETEKFKLTNVARARFQMSTASGVSDGFSLDLENLEEGKDYGLYQGQPDANPYSIWFYDWPSWPGYPLFLQGRRPYSDEVTFSAEADVTNAPIHILVPAAKLQLLDSVLIPRMPTDQRWQFFRAKAVQELQAATVARPVSSVGKARPFFTGVVRV